MLLQQMEAFKPHTNMANLAQQIQSVVIGLSFGPKVFWAELKSSEVNTLKARLKVLFKVN